MGDRRNPFEGMEAELRSAREPVGALGLVGGLPSGLGRRPTGGRKTGRRPAEKRRRARRVNVTFSDAEIPERLRALAREWDMVAPDGRSPNVSAVVEALVMPLLCQAEAGDFVPDELG